MSTFYSLNPDVDLPLIHGFFDSVKAYLPTNVTVTIDGSGDVLDETTGLLTGGWDADSPAPVGGTGGGNYSAPAGMVVIWETAFVVDGSRLRGKTYLVPMAQGIFTTDGSPDNDSVTTLRGIAQSFAAENSLVVWHRPRAARAADGSRPAVSARAGAYANISGATVRDFTAILTSRRD